MNIIYKSTAHVSIGDDIAFLGTKKLFDQIIPGHNAFLYSRNEKDAWKASLGIKIDLVVVAGTPIWSGSQMVQLEDYIISNSIPTFYCGVGMNYGNNDKTSASLSNCIGFIGRDNYATRRAKQDYPEAKTICCPSVFSVEVGQQTSDKIGIILQVDTWPEKQLQFIKKHDPVTTLIICNEIVDYVWAQSNVNEYEIVYSRWLSDMAAFYLRCRAIYSMRIHGAHLAYALGVPTVCMKSEKDKSVVCKTIGLNLVPPETASESDLACDQDIKMRHFTTYVEYLTKHLSNRFPGITAG